MSTIDINGRPRPILEQVKTVGSAVALAASVVTSLVGWGVFTAAQGDALTGLLGAIPGAVTLVGAVVTAFRVARAAEPFVTPVEDPRDDKGQALVPAPTEGGVHRITKP
ncbi:hypothetical protein BBK82_04930 [Lentzea guizhouensis]|uniref:Uncharacterized protein n=1 Tax=Lentzea guizhouensis TaxID=1586287 RepID=A0A1B2HCS3_9PSEU|nr:hypothetical protein [Lentzea guizhouensis]ANZ35520.1 hypothetical protein BBK82_04930 [Lentzea guizhouensis]